MGWLRSAAPARKRVVVAGDRHVDVVQVVVAERQHPRAVGVRDEAVVDQVDGVPGLSPGHGRGDRGRQREDDGGPAHAATPPPAARRTPPPRCGSSRASPMFISSIVRWPQPTAASGSGLTRLAAELSWYAVTCMTVPAGSVNGVSYTYVGCQSQANRSTSLSSSGAPGAGPDRLQRHRLPPVVHVRLEADDAGRRGQGGSRRRCARSARPAGMTRSARLDTALVLTTYSGS